MSDHDILATVAKKVGRPFQHTLEGDRCVELDLTSEECLFSSMIRRHTPTEKEEIVKLVSQLTSLRKLNLGRAKLGSLPESFGQLTEMRHLQLGSNYIGKVPEQIRGFAALKYLHLGNNDITELPEWIADFARLEYLTLHKNIKLRALGALAGQKTLKALNLYLVSLGRLPDFMYGLGELTTLTLWNVHSISDDIARLSNLEFFTDCGAPMLRELPAGFTGLKKLRMARIYQNNLERLPENIGDLVNLEQLSVYQNQLSSLPDSMERLGMLTKLNLGWNCFKTLPKWIGTMKSLEWLAVFENPLTADGPIPVHPSVRVERGWPFTTLPS